ncbi:hypothetical protein AGMMS50276_05750 [Synergistales bacterium]|nr:hypothetical protein AGMMS50276_05750 [Synergistales bacterium]
MHIFDLMLKRLISLSDSSTIHLINGLFDKDYPQGSKVEYPNVENVSAKLRKRLSDKVIAINGDKYHIEAEIKDNAEIMVRMFDYDYADALSAKELHEDGNMFLKFPEARVIYWEPTKKTPDEVSLHFKFSNGQESVYNVKTFKLFDYSIKELGDRKLTTLLPFYVMKLRKKIAGAKSSKARQGLSGEMKVVLDELVDIVERCEAAGTIAETDSNVVLSMVDRLYQELYGQYGELAEVDIMLQDRLVTRFEEALLERGQKGHQEGRQKGRQEGLIEAALNLLKMGLDKETVSKGTGLSMEEVQKLAY